MFAFCYCGSYSLKLCDEGSASFNDYILQLFCSFMFHDDFGTMVPCVVPFFCYMLKLCLFFMKMFIKLDVYYSSNIYDLFLVKVTNSG